MDEWEEISYEDLNDWEKAWVDAYAIALARSLARHANDKEE